MGKGVSVVECGGVVGDGVCRWRVMVLRDGVQGCRGPHHASSTTALNDPGQHFATRLGTRSEQLETIWESGTAIFTLSGSANYCLVLFLTPKCERCNPSPRTCIKPAGRFRGHPRQSHTVYIPGYEGRETAPFSLLLIIVGYGRPVGERPWTRHGHLVHLCPEDQPVLVLPRRWDDTGARCSGSGLCATWVVPPTAVRRAARYEAFVQRTQTPIAAHTWRLNDT